MPGFSETSWFRRLVALAWLATGSSALAADPPRLTVVIVIDQFRHENLHRFADLFVDDGFRRFMDGGAWMTDATFGLSTESGSNPANTITLSTWRM